MRDAHFKTARELHIHAVPWRFYGYRLIFLKITF